MRKQVDEATRHGCSCLLVFLFPCLLLLGSLHHRVAVGTLGGVGVVPLDFVGDERRAAAGTLSGQRASRLGLLCHDALRHFFQREAHFAQSFLDGALQFVGFGVMALVVQILRHTGQEVGHAADATAVDEEQQGLPPSLHCCTGVTSGEVCTSRLYHQAGGADGLAKFLGLVGQLSEDVGCLGELPIRHQAVGAGQRPVRSRRQRWWGRWSPRRVWARRYASPEQRWTTEGASAKQTDSSCFLPLAM